MWSSVRYFLVAGPVVAGPIEDDAVVAVPVVAGPVAAGPVANLSGGISTLVSPGSATITGSATNCDDVDAGSAAATDAPVPADAPPSPPGPPILLLGAADFGL